MCLVWIYAALGRKSLRVEGSAGPGYGHGAVDAAVKRMNQWLGAGGPWDGGSKGKNDSYMRIRNRDRKLTIRVQKRASEEIRVMNTGEKLKDQVFSHLQVDG